MRLQIGNTAKSLAITLATLFLCNGAIFYQNTFGIPPLLQAVTTLLIYLAGALLSRTVRPSLAVEGVALGIVFALLTPHQFHSSPFFQWRKGWLFVCIGLLPMFFIVSWTIGAGRLRGSAIGLALCCSAAALGSAGVLSLSGGYPLFSDDHPAFMYRLLQLKHHFPSIPFYNPGWNGGVEAREFFPSGVLGLFLLWSPLIYLTDLWDTYNVIVVGTLFLITPSLLALATYLQFSSIAAATFAATLSIACSSIWYRWGLSYGTLPFLLSVSALPLAFACMERMLASRSRISLTLATTFIVSASLSIFWSLGVLLLAPVLFIGSIITLKEKSEPKKKFHFALCLLSLALLHLPWMILFASASKIFSFLSPAPANGALGQSITDGGAASATAKKVISSTFLSPHIQREGVLRGSISLAQEFLRATNPLLIALSLPALATLDKSSRIRHIVVIALAVLLAVCGPILKPQLELQRFWLFATAFVIPVVAFTLSQLITAPRISFQKQLVATLFLTILATTPWFAWRVGRNATSEHFTFANSEVYELAQSITQHAGAGRAMFAGFVLHELHGGHIAPLQTLTNVPLIASSYQHDKWRYTDVVPPDFLARKTKGIDEYLDLMNVSLVVAHSSDWKKWYRARRKKFKEVAIVGRWVLFTRIGFSPSYLQRGSAEIKIVSGDTIHVIPHSEKLTLKFQHLPLLTATGCTLAPEPVGAKLSLISLADCPLYTPVFIKMRGPISRVFSLLTPTSSPN